MKNLHLVPALIQDLVSKLVDPSIRENEKFNYQIRIEAIKDYCEVALNNANKKTNVKVASRK